MTKYLKLLAILVLLPLNLNAQGILGNLLGGLLDKTSATNGSVKVINDRLCFVGRTKKKMPYGNGQFHSTNFDYTPFMGNGTLFDQKTGAFIQGARHGSNITQDVVIGQFNNGYVTNATAEFRMNYNLSEWSYKGDLMIEYDNNYVSYILLPKGIITTRNSYNSTIVKKTIPVIDTVEVKRNLRTFELDFPYMRILSSYAFNLDNQDFFGIPSEFFKQYDVLFETSYVENKGWQFKCNSSNPGLKKDRSEEIVLKVVDCSKGRVEFKDGSWYSRRYDTMGNPISEFAVKLADGSIILTCVNNDIQNLRAQIKYNNGDNYDGKVNLVDAHNYYIRPSILESDEYYFRNLSLKKDISLITGVYNYANGTSTRYENGYNDNARQQIAIEQAKRQREAKQAAQEKAQKNAARLAQTKKLLPRLYGKKYSYSSYSDYYTGWVKHNGNSSIRFSPNRQDVFVNIGSDSYWLKMDEIIETGEISCHEVGAGYLAGTCYLTPSMKNGAMEFLIYFPTTGGLRYKLSK